MSPDKENPRIVVIGSVNMDLVVRAQRMPAPGETLLGGRFTSTPGGKGANQAVAVARLNAECHLVGRLGADEFGDRLASQLETIGVGVEHLVVTEGESSGIATIIVDSSGENAIVVASGANARVCPEDIDQAETLIASADAVLLQLELPVATVAHAVTVARRHGVCVVLDPAPTPGEPLPPACYDVDVINPNQVEAAQLANEQIGDDYHSAKMVAAEFLRRGARAAVIKLGRRRALAVDSDGQMTEVPAFSVNVVDTTAAGDAFAAALTTALARGEPLDEATRFGCAAGALACTRMGAQPAMPALMEVHALLESG